MCSGCVGWKNLGFGPGKPLLHWVRRGEVTKLMGVCSVAPRGAGSPEGEEWREEAARLELWGSAQSLSEHSEDPFV